MLSYFVTSLSNVRAVIPAQPTPTVLLSHCSFSRPNPLGSIISMFSSLTPLESGLTLMFRVLPEINRESLSITRLESALTRIFPATPLFPAHPKNGGGGYPIASRRSFPPLRHYDSARPICRTIGQHQGTSGHRAFLGNDDV